MMSPANLRARELQRDDIVQDSARRRLASQAELPGRAALAPGLTWTLASPAVGNLEQVASWSWASRWWRTKRLPRLASLAVLPRATAGES